MTSRLKNPISLALLSCLLVTAVSVSWVTAQPSVGGSQNEAREKIQELLNNYPRALHQVFLNQAPPDMMLNYFNQPTRDWFLRREAALATLNKTWKKPTQTVAQRRLAALDAALRYGPSFYDARIQGIYLNQTAGLVVLQEGVNVYYLPVEPRVDRTWVFSSFFFSETMIWEPLIINTKLEAGERLTPEEEDFRRRGQTQLQAMLLELCRSTGAPLPEVKNK